MSKTQMLKGILEGCLLLIIREGEIYGYEMAEKLKHYQFEEVSEGSIYPVLIRLQKEGCVSTTLKKSLAGPKRKYYQLTEKGEEEATAFVTRWQSLSDSVNNLITGKKS